jgi:hypothetical protein
MRYKARQTSEEPTEFVELRQERNSARVSLSNNRIDTVSTVVYEKSMRIPNNGDDLVEFESEVEHQAVQLLSRNRRMGYSKAQRLKKDEAA